MQALLDGREVRKKSIFEIVLRICAVLIAGITVLYTLGMFVDAGLGMWAEDAAEARARQRAALDCMGAGLWTGLVSCAVFVVRGGVLRFFFKETAACRKMRGGVDFAAGTAVLAAGVFLTVYFSLYIPAFSFMDVVFPMVLIAAAAVLFAEGSMILVRVRRESGAGQA